MNNALTFNVIVNFLMVAGYGYLFVRQLLVTTRGHDVVTPLRVIVLLVFTIAIVTLIPVAAYQTAQLYGLPSDGLRNIVTILSPVNRIATMGLLIVFVNYRIRGDE